MIERPNVIYDDKKHTYELDGVKLDGVSTVAKIGETEIWGVASAWAFRIGYEGAYDVLTDSAEWAGTPNPNIYAQQGKDALREALKQARKTPWNKTDEAKDRGNAIHE